jgi:hypothetical protein
MSTRLEELEAELQALQDDHSNRMELAFAALQATIDLCTAIGVVPTVHVKVNDPPHMGSKQMGANVRMTRGEYQKMMALEAAVEQEKETMRRMGGDYDHP